MRKNIILNLLAPLAVLTLLGLNACKDETNEKFEPERMFMPTGAIQATGAVTAVKLSWKEALYVNPTETSYTVEVATDTLFSTPIVQTATTDTAGITFTDAQLNVRQRYFARVKTNATGTVPESKWVVSSRFAIPGIQIFTDIQAIDRAVAFNWRPTPGLTRLVITPADGAAFTVPVTAADVAAGRKIVQNLQANTVYTAEIFAGNRSNGFTTFRTAVPLSGNLVDLRGFDNRPGVLADTLPLVAAGSTIILKRGQQYDINTSISLSKAVTILSGADLTEQNLATIYFTGNFNFAANSTIDYIDFKDVVLTSDSYASRYIFNTTNGATVNRISFDGVRAEIFRGLMRLQSGNTTVNEFRVNNSVLDSLSNYGVLTVDNVSCRVNNISIRNSTIYKAENIIVSRQNANSVVLENLTINEAPRGGGSNYLVDFNTSASNNVANGVAITNCILGIGKANSGRNVRGTRAGSATNVLVTNTYKTSDYSDISTAGQLPNLIAYSKTSFELFNDPRRGDFTIKDAGFAGRTTAGDPRWRP